jgi:tyrosinase
MRIRRNVKYLTATEKTAFTNAVLALKTKPSVLHPGTSNRYDDYPETHMAAMMVSPGWAHRAPAFFPWHRELLLQFENDIQAVDSSVTIPYWDWTDSASDPFTADFLGGNGTGTNQKVMDGPFAFDGPHHWTIKVKDSPSDPQFLQRDFGADFTAPSLPSGPQVVTVQAVTPYDLFPWHDNTGAYRAQMEVNLHNLVHRYIGGTMGAMTSPNDPVFWLHHCNIDRLWAEWQQLHPTAAPYQPVTGAAAGQNLHDNMIFSAGPPAPWPGSTAPADVIDHIALGYTYDWSVAKVPHIPLAAVRILFGIINDAPGVFIGPDGKPHPVPGGPGDPVWTKLTQTQRDRVAASALVEISSLISNTTARAEIQKAAKSLTAPGRVQRATS